MHCHRHPTSTSRGPGQWANCDAGILTGGLGAWGPKNLMGPGEVVVLHPEGAVLMPGEPRRFHRACAMRITVLTLALTSTLRACEQQACRRCDDRCDLGFIAIRRRPVLLCAIAGVLSLRAKNCLQVPSALVRFKDTVWASYCHRTGRREQRKRECDHF
jgi:hypothetical protein